MTISEPKTTAKNLDLLAINTIRTLSMDAVQAAKSGHPGTPMALAPVAYVLWQQFLRYDPEQPDWPNRDRFILSAGHASMLLYSLLHLAGAQDLDRAGKPTGRPAVSLDDIKAFRQLGSRTPGHPEHTHTTGVEATTGPLGQGVGTSVGLAIAGRWLAARYNRPDATLFDYNVWAICSDGDLMEGVSHEAASLAGHLQLSNLCWIYDNNHITIEGSTSLAYSDDVPARFRAYGWNVVRVRDANDLDALRQAYEAFEQTNDQPTLIVVDTNIAYGSPNKQDTAAAHGEPLGEEEVRLTKQFYGWPADEHFLVPNGVREQFRGGIGARGAALRRQWEATRQAYREHYPDLANELDLMQQGELPVGWDHEIPTFPADAKGLASRESSGKVLQAIAQRVPWLIGGAADLAPSTKTLLRFDGVGAFEARNYDGRNLHFGIREHGMAAAANGLALAKLRPYASSFLIFTDYARGGIRLSALMELPVIYIWTHDSLSLGEDGPTHQPIEHLASFRAMPGMIVIRPGDANEVAEAWRVVMQLKDRPAMLVLSRQAIPTLDRAKYAPAAGLARGGYVLADCEGTPEVLLIATGSEVPLCAAAYEQLASEGVRARVVSLPSWELFEEQPQAYKDGVLPPAVKARVAVEQGSTLGWAHYAGNSGAIIGMKTFGASAPAKDLLAKFGFTTDAIVAAAKAQLAAHR